jgi:hypothetical protein
MIFTHYTPETDPASIPRTDVLVLVSRTHNSGNPVHAWKLAKYFGQYELDASDDDTEDDWAEEGPNQSGMYAPAGFYALSLDEDEYRTPWTMVNTPSTAGSRCRLRWCPCR